MSRPVVGLILVGAGASRRMGGTDKIWADLGGTPLVRHSIQSLSPEAQCTVLVLREEQLVLGRRLAASFPNVSVAAGGKERYESVLNGIDALGPNVDVVAVHDVARPFAPASLLRRGVDALREWAAAVPALPLADTIKEVDEQGAVARTVDRRALRAIQTPQVFRAETLRRAHASWDGKSTPTDDAQMVEACGEEVWTFPGSADAFKVTTEADLRAARLIFASRLNL